MDLISILNVITGKSIHCPGNFSYIDSALKYHYPLLDLLSPGKFSDTITNLELSIYRNLILLNGNWLGHSLAKEKTIF
jgi:hypothetical protein